MWNAYNVLTFIIQREGLFFKESSCTTPKAGESSENFAFKLYSDGIREMTFHQGIERGRRAVLLRLPCGTPSGTAGTKTMTSSPACGRKNLPTLTIVTADEVMKLSEVDDVLAPQGSSTAEGSLREILAEANAKKPRRGKGDPQRKPGFRPA